MRVPGARGGDDDAARPVANGGVQRAPSVSSAATTIGIGHDGRGRRRRQRCAGVRAAGAAPPAPPPGPAAARRGWRTRRAPRRGAWRPRRPRGPARPVTTSTPAPRAAGATATLTASRRLRGAVPAGLAGVPHGAGHDDRPRVARGRGPRRRRSPRGCRSPARPRRRGPPGRPARRPRRRRSRSTSAKREVARRGPAQVDRDDPPRSARPGTDASSWSPASVGTAPPATGSTVMLIVPPVKMTATRGIALTARRATAGHGDVGRGRPRACRQPTRRPSARRSAAGRRPVGLDRLSRGPRRARAARRATRSRPRGSRPRHRGGRASCRPASEIGPTMMIGRKLPTDTSMLRIPKTRPRTAGGISSWSSVWAGIAVDA